MTSLKGQTGLPLTEGEPASVRAALSPLLAHPAGPTTRTLLLGDTVTVVDRDMGHAFVQAAKDGYCGWLAEADIGQPLAATHRVATPATHLYSEPRVKALPLMPLVLNARLCVTSTEGAWAETPLGFVPLSHLSPTGHPAPDPVAVAETLLHAPYLWGGNSVFGVDCSGLVQLALHAAGHPCPGDSDQQRSLGTDIPEGTALQRGDLVFWKGHVALMAAPDRILHANGASMSVAYEDLAMAITRIAAAGDGPVLARRRLSA